MNRSGPIFPLPLFRNSAILTCPGDFIGAIPICEGFTVCTVNYARDLLVGNMFYLQFSSGEIFCRASDSYSTCLLGCLHFVLSFCPLSLLIFFLLISRGKCLVSQRARASPSRLLARPPSNLFFEKSTVPPHSQLRITQEPILAPFFCLFRLSITARIPPLPFIRFGTQPLGFVTLGDFFCLSLPVPF